MLSPAPRAQNNTMMLRRFLPLVLMAAGFALPSLLHHRFIHVVTPSIPPGWYFVDHAAPHTGDYVIACLPESIAAFGLQRGYLIPGDCPRHVAPIVKVLVAHGGDTLTLASQQTTVNTVRVGGALPSHDGYGRALPHMPFGTYRVAEGSVWLLGEHHRSWDSRYFGPLAATAIIGRAHPLITTPSAVQ
jgi:conjugative transfer signal peptidase TraF